jgi:preprotein translocase subunit SecE
MAKEAKKKEKKMKDNTNKKASNKDKRHFLKDVKAELKKVIWPTPKQLLNNTLAVIASVLIVGVIVFLLDLCFEKINTFGVEKLKTIVQSSQNEEADQNTVDNSNTESNAENTNSEAEGSNEESETVSEDTSSEENTDNSDNAE